jgi:hypothetical protein
MTVLVGMSIAMRNPPCLLPDNHRHRSLPNLQEYPVVFLIIATSQETESPEFPGRVSSHGQTATHQKSGEDLLPVLPGGTLFNSILGRVIGL